MVEHDEDDNMLRGIDLDAWQPPAPRGDLASAVIARMALPAEPVIARRGKRTLWLASGGVIGAAIIAIAVLAWRTDPDAGTQLADRVERGDVVATRPQHLELDGIAVDLDAGAELHWTREPGGVRIEGLRGRSTWKIAKDVRARIDTGAMGASVEATGASLRMEVRMNASDVRMAGTTAAIAAAVALVTVVVYEGHVKATSGARTIVVTSGSTVELEPGKPPRPPVDPAVIAGEATIASDQRPGVKPIAVIESEPIKPIAPDRRPVDPPGAKPIAAIESEPIEPIAPDDVQDGSRAEALNSSMVQSGIAPVKAAVMACGDRSSARGKVKLNVKVTPEGRVATATVKETPDAALGACVVKATKAATFAKTRSGGSFNYVYSFAPISTAVAEPCDADALREKGKDELSSGNYAAALVTFELEYRCKPDRVLFQIMALSACKSGNAAKAKLYYPKVPAASQAGVAQTCLTSKTAYE